MLKFLEASPDFQWEMLQKRIRPHTKKILLGCLLLLAAALGWQWWQHRALKNIERASIIYEELQKKISKQETQAAIIPLRHLMVDYPHTAYAGLAALLTARLAVDQKNYEQALAPLRWVLEHASLPWLKQTARIHLARILIFQKRLEEASAVLEVVDDSSYSPLVEELKAQIKREVPTKK